MEKSISDLIVGDKVYCDSRFGSYTIGTITKIGKLHFTVSANERIIKIDKRNGYEAGSRGEGRYSAFNSRYWYPLTSEKMLEFKSRSIVLKIRDFTAKIKPESIKTEEDYTKARDTLAQLQNIFKEGLT